MGTKYAEIVIAMHYRERDAKGVMRGGAMYTLKKRGLGWLGAVFALLTSLAAFGIGNMVQANSVAQSLNATFGVSHVRSSASVLVVISAAVILGGIKRIAAFAEILVPFMAIFYLGRRYRAADHARRSDPGRLRDGVRRRVQRHARQRADSPARRS